MHNFDVLVAGSGISGLFYALKISAKLPNKNIVIVTKDNDNETNTKYAQGGIAVVNNFKNDSIHKHIQDTLTAGSNLCKTDIVEKIISNGPKQLEELLNMGVDFDLDKKGNLDLHLEGGHSEKRIAHHKDETGKEIENTLLKLIKRRKNITFLKHHFIIDLITEHHLKDKHNTKNNSKKNCFGAYLLDIKNQKIKTIIAQITILATGGAGQIYQNTTNPNIATGDGIGIAYRAKAKTSNMAFFQFHPTALYHNEFGRKFLISEAVRGFGAKLTLKDHSQFIHKYDNREELASRDIVAKAIDYEMKSRGEDFVLLNLKEVDKKQFIHQFPNIYNHTKKFGLKIFKDGIPVVPAAHYMCGGIEVNIYGQTNIGNLFAIGECACTGLHGANRLASNSLLEALVCADYCTQKSEMSLKQENFIDFSLIPDWNEEDLLKPEEIVLISFLKKELQSVMSNLVGIVRSNKRLKLAENYIESIYFKTKEFYNSFKLTTELLELRNMVNTAYLVVQDSLKQTENRGAFYNKDLNGK